MSRAFVREDDGTNDIGELPDKLISEHRNLVTSYGLALIDAEVERLNTVLAVARADNDRGALAGAARELRYWTQRRLSAEVMPAPADAGTVQFGLRVVIQRADGRRQTFRIVGEDEADPTLGTLSYVSPLAQALLGKSVGDEVLLGNAMIEIAAIEI